MSIPYIEMRCNLWTNPKVRLMAHITGHKVAAIIGGLHWFWSQVHEHGEGDGVSGLTARDVDKFTKLRGFADALSEVGWGEFSQNRAVAVRFSENSTANAKERERVYNANRKQKWRSRAKEAGIVPSCPGDSPIVSPTPKQSKAQLSTAEQSKAEKAGRVATVVEIPSGLDTSDFREAWERWKSHRREIRHPLRPTTEASQLRTLAEWGEARAVAAIDFTIFKGWQGIREPETQHAGSNGTTGHSVQREDFDGCLPGETTLQALVRKGKL